MSESSLLSDVLAFNNRFSIFRELDIFRMSSRLSNILGMVCQYPVGELSGSKVSISNYDKRTTESLTSISSQLSFRVIEVHFRICKGFACKAYHISLLSFISRITA